MVCVGCAPYGYNFRFYDNYVGRKASKMHSYAESGNDSRYAIPNG